MASSSTVLWEFASPPPGCPPVPGGGCEAGCSLEDVGDPENGPKLIASLSTKCPLHGPAVRRVLREEGW